MSYSKNVTWENEYHSSYYRRDWNVQAKPFKAPLDFRFESRQCTSTRPGAPGNISSCVPFLTNDYTNTCHNRAHKALMDKVRSERAEWLAFVAQYRESVEMIRTRALQLCDFAVKLRRGNVLGALSALGVRNPEAVIRSRGRRAKAKQYGDAWLEYHFGWSPLIKDIYSSIKTLTTDFTPRKVVAFGKAEERVVDFIGQWIPNYVTNLWEWHVSTFSRSTNYSEKLGTTIVVSNSDANLAEQMGLTNPISVAWDLVPFSFLVDWLSNAGDVVSACMGVTGVSFINPCTVQVQRTVRSDSYFDGHVLATSFYCIRSRGIDNPSFEFQLPDSLSATRGATAIALLMKLL